jgi:hypothetical protein
MARAHNGIQLKGLQQAQADNTTRCCGLPDYYSKPHLKSLPRYKYEPLKLPCSTRVLRIISPEQSALTISLKEAPLGADQTSSSKCNGSGNLEIVSYTALSYTWASESRPHLISCDGATLAITCSLLSALHRLREAFSPETSFFADCISINQAQDPAALLERASQIKLMHLIFAQADEVVADLGEHADDSSYAITILEPLSGLYTSYSNAREELAASRGLNLPLYSQRTSQALIHFCSRRWFRRLWIVQEVVLSRRIRFLIGKLMVEGRVILDGVPGAHRLYRTRFSLTYWYTPNPITYRRIRDCQHALATAAKLMFEIQSLRDLRDSGSAPPGHLLEVTRLFDVTYKHDRIYAVMGMMSQEAREAFIVDPDESLEHLAIRLNKLVVDQGGLDIALSLLASFEASARPSWSYDFFGIEMADVRVRWLMQEDGRLNCVYNASGGTPAEANWLSSSSDLLTVRGSRMGRIIALSDPLAQCGDSLDRLAIAMIPWEYHFRKIAFQHLPNLSKAGFQRLLLETIVGGGYLGAAGSMFNLRGCLEECLQAALIFIPGNFARWVISDPHIWLTGNKLRQLADFRNKAGVFLRNVVWATRDRVVCITEHGQFGLVPVRAQIGDSVAIIKGCPEAFVLRPHESHSKLVGTAYLHGFMHGEALDSKHWHEEDIRIG